MNSLNGLDRSWCFSLAMWLTRTIYWLETRQAHLSNREEKQSSWEISVPKPQSRIQAGSLYPSDQGRLGTEFFRQAWQVTSHPKSPWTTGNKAAPYVVPKSFLLWISSRIFEHRTSWLLEAAHLKLTQLKQISCQETELLPMVLLRWLSSWFLISKETLKSIKRHSRLDHTL